MKIEKININQIERDTSQPRQDFKDINDLVNSILKEGLIEPLKVRKDKEKYILVDGERRYRALNILFKQDKEFYKFIDCIIINPKEVFITQLSTDLHKRRLNPFEEAEAFKKLINDGWEISDLKSRLGVSGSMITRRIKLLGLSRKTKELIEKKILPQSVIGEIDFKKYKDNEQQIIKRISSECSGKNKREKIKRIIKEETEKQKAVLNHFKIDLENFSKVIRSYDFKLDDFKLDDFLNEPIKDVQNVLSESLEKVNSLIQIKEKLENVKKKLDNLKSKYGGGFELTKEILSNSSPPVRTSDRKSDTKVEFNTDLKEVQK